MASSTSLLGTRRLLHCKLFAQDQNFSFLFATKIEHSSTKIELETMLAYGKDQAVHLPPFLQ